MSAKQAQFEKMAKTLAARAVGGVATTEKQADLSAMLNSPYAPYVVGGLGGAGLGALLGAMQPKRKGRNALYYGSLGGLGGLGLAHLWQQANSGASKKPAAPPPPTKNSPPKPAPITPETPVVASKPPVLPAAVPPAKDAPPSVQVAHTEQQEWLKNNPWAHPALFQGGKPNVPRHPLAAKLRHDRGLTPFQNWLQTGKSTDAWYDARNIFGDKDDEHAKKFEGILRDYYEKTKTPAESLSDLVEIGYLPEGIDAPFGGILPAGADISTSSRYLDDVNAMRQLFVTSDQPLHAQVKALNVGPLSFARAAQILGLSPENAFKQYRAAAKANDEASVRAWTDPTPRSNAFF